MFGGFLLLYILRVGLILLGVYLLVRFILWIVKRHK